jgi:septum formation protein
MPVTTHVSLVLASASPRRRHLLDAVGLRFELAPANLDEEALAAGLPPEESALVVAAAKAAAVTRRDACVLAADTIVVLDGVVFGKPASSERAREMLAALRGRDHEVITAVAVRTPDGERRTACRSVVRMRAYSAAEIDAYVAAGGGRDKAGAYGIQDEPFRPVETIEGCWCNVMGLPLWTALRMLADGRCAAPLRPDQAFARCASCPSAPGAGT